MYLAITHIGGAGVWVSMLVLAQHGALGGHPLGGSLATFVACASLIGFSTKAGLMPFHSWLPRAHPLAPAHISALMSGVMIKLALYGLVRVLFEWLTPPGLWVGITLMAVGALSCVGGVLYALMQHELKRLLAFCSIENVGIVALGLGASLVFRDIGQPTWSAIAFAAALLHALNHALFKGLSVPRRGCVRKGGRRFGARSSRGPVAPDAVDRRGVRARRDGNRRAAAAERVCLGVADAPVAAAPRGREPPRGRARGRAWRPRRSPGPRRLLCTAS